MRSISYGVFRAEFCFRFYFYFIAHFSLPFDLLFACFQYLYSGQATVGAGKCLDEGSDPLPHLAVLDPLLAELTDLEKIVKKASSEELEDARYRMLLRRVCAVCATVCLRSHLKSCRYVSKSALFLSVLLCCMRRVLGRVVCLWSSLNSRSYPSSAYLCFARFFQSQGGSNPLAILLKKKSVPKHGSRSSGWLWVNGFDRIYEYPLVKETPSKFVETLA